MAYARSVRTVYGPLQAAEGAATEPLITSRLAARLRWEYVVNDL